MEWNKIDVKILNLAPCNVFRKVILIEYNCKSYTIEFLQNAERFKT